MTIGKFNKPALVLADRDDRCPFSAPMDAELLASKFVASPRREAKIMAGGNPNGDPCANFSPHGFYDVEDDTLDVILGFMNAGK